MRAVNLVFRGGGGGSGGGGTAAGAMVTEAERVAAVGDVDDEEDGVGWYCLKVSLFRKEKIIYSITSENKIILAIED